MVAKGIELFVDAVFAVDDQGLVLGDVVGLAEIFKDRGDLGFKAVGERLMGDVLVRSVFTGEQVEGSLAVTGFNSLAGLDLDVRKEDAAFLVEFVVNERAIGFLGFQD